VRQASKRNSDAIEAGRVDLRHGSAEKLPDFGAPFDKIFEVNSVGFWKDPVECLRRIRALLKPGGTIAIVSQPRGPGATDEWSSGAAAEIQERLAEAGYSILRVESLPLKPAVVCVLATGGGGADPGA